MNPELTDTANLATRDAFLNILLPFGAALNKNCEYPILLIETSRLLLECF